MTFVALIVLLIMCSMAHTVHAQACDQLLPAMTAAMQDLRQGQALTPAQETTWRTWNAHCKEVTWQQQLAAATPPVRPQDMRREPPPAARPRDDRTFWEKLIDNQVESHKRYSWWQTYCRDRRNLTTCTTTGW